VAASFKLVYTQQKYIVYSHDLYFCKMVQCKRIQTLTHLLMTHKFYYIPHSFIHTENWDSGLARTEKIFLPGFNIKSFLCENV